MSGQPHEQDSSSQFIEVSPSGDAAGTGAGAGAGAGTGTGTTAESVESLVAVQQLVRWYPSLIAVAVLQHPQKRPLPSERTETAPMGSGPLEGQMSATEITKAEKEAAERNSKRWEQLKTEYYERESKREEQEHEVEAARLERKKALQL